MLLPDGPDLRHLDRMTDDTGLIQHAIYGVPRRESGYTIDDNARALGLCSRLWGRAPSGRMLERVTTYLGLLEYARRPGGGFHNLMNYQRQWLVADATGDCQGQAVRALAEVLASGLPVGYRLLARELIDSAVPTLAEVRSLRAQAYVILACERLRCGGVRDVEKLERLAWTAAQHLMECYQRSRRPSWHWFESRMTYANAVLPHAMFGAAVLWPQEAFLGVARESYSFLDGQTTAHGVFRPVGNNGWYSHGEPMAEYDQQPVEAMTMVEAALASWAASGETPAPATLGRVHAWFHGRNTSGIALADPDTGGCFDGLQPAGVNRNQGAESTLSYLWTRLHALEQAAAPLVKEPLEP